MAGKTAYLGIGGNIGDVRRTMYDALDMLNRHQGLSVIQVSKIYKTPPWGVKDQDWFLNACVEIQTTLPPIELMQLCLETEKDLGRVREKRWGPRIIDLDILDIEGVQMDTDVLTLPHPRIAERDFVLVPLAEIAPLFTLNGSTCSELMSQLAPTEITISIDHQDWWQPKENA